MCQCLDRRMVGMIYPSMALRIPRAWVLRSYSFRPPEGRSSLREGVPGASGAVPDYGGDDPATRESTPHKGVSALDLVRPRERNQTGPRRLRFNPTRAQAQSRAAVFVISITSFPVPRPRICDPSPQEASRSPIGGSAQVE
jgi:hypothetical protein